MRIVLLAVAVLLSACRAATDDTTPPDAARPPDFAPPDLAPWATGLEVRPANSTCISPQRPPSGAAAQVVPAFTRLSFSIPIYLVQAPGDASRWFVVQKGGVVKTFAADETTTVTSNFIDITPRVNSGPNEAGLLGMAFHPRWQQNHYVYLSYTAFCPNGRTACAGSGLLSTISRFNSVDGGKTLDPSSEKVILRLDQPEENHNGGNINFGSDGFLYIGFGDGGGGGDGHGTIGNGQDTSVLLGKLLRIDVDGGDPYAIPQDNPFAGRGGVDKPEIYAYGLRNPWRWSFDIATGELWVGDVGQNLYEEVDQVKRGGNYGWRVMEGLHCYNPQSCNMNLYDPPIIEYDHGGGRCAITGGYVYRGALIPSLTGNFIYGDYCAGTVWALTYDNAGKAAPTVIPGGTGMTSFGQSLSGEVYLVLANGRLAKLAPTMGGNDSFPKKLSQTGCVDPMNPKVPAPGLIPYDVASPLWSDGAAKRRWMALPDGKKIHVNVDGDFDLPVGSVLMKEFAIAGKRVETRLLVRHDDGDWGGYSYQWDDSESDAALLPSSATRLVGNQTWYYPSRAECLQCHTVAAGRSLGLESAQLNILFQYPNGRLANQDDTLDHIGLFDAPLGTVSAVLASPAGMDPLDARARSYLHANCAYCHRPNSTGRGPADFRYLTPANMLGVCNVDPIISDLGVAGAKLLRPGDPTHSVISLRMHALDVNRMPPLGTRVVDATGTTLIDQWITSLGPCP